MGRLIDMDLKGYLVFEDTPSCDLTESQARQALAEFLSLKTRMLSTLEWKSSHLAFAHKYGNLLPRPTRLELPKGVLSFVDAPTNMPHGKKVIIETEDQWSSWSLRLRDIALVHSWKWLPWRHGEAPYVRLLRDNLIVYKQKEKLMCLFRASSASSSRYSTDGLPDALGAYFSAIGSPFFFARPISGTGMQEKALWMDRNAEALIEALANHCIGTPLPTDSSLLSRFMRELAILAAGDKPMGFCLVCGAATLPDDRRRPARYESAVHRMALHRGRAVFEATLTNAGFSDAEAKSIFEAHDLN